MNTEYIRVLYRFNSWANERIFETASQLTSDQFTGDIHSRSIRDALMHIVFAEWLWLKRWKGESPREMWDSSNFPDVNSLREKLISVQNEQSAFLESLQDTMLPQIISYRNLQDEPWEYSLWQQMVHPVNHSSYHRGQVATLFRQISGKGALPTDFLVYFDEHPGEKH